MATSLSNGQTWFRTLLTGFVAGLLAGLLMLLAMMSLRLFQGVPTPMEMIFDRVFPLVTVDLFIGALSRAGSYSALKLDSTMAALLAQLIVAGVGGSVYAWYRRRFPRRSGGSLVLPGVLAVAALFSILLWPNLLTSYRGLPPGKSTFISIVGMLLSFSVCGLSLMAFHRLLTGMPFGPGDSSGAATSGEGVGRRAFLAGGAGAVAAVLLGGVLHRLYRRGTFFYDGKQYGGPGVRKITPTQPDDEFYQVTKNLVDPDPARSLWRLEIGGQVDTPRSFTFSDLAAMRAVTQETTLLCISYGVGSGLCSNAVWKGVPLAELLEQVKPWGDNAAILFHAADGYYETFRFSKALEPTTLLAYEMNGEPLPQRHGFPLRLIVPGLYGEKSAKWLTRLEVVDRADPRLHRPHGLGFYEEQGWGPDDTIPTHSRIDAPQVNGDHFATPFKAGEAVEFRGMAFGGDRGISKVEISTDDGQAWTPAEIHQPGTQVSWSLWRFRWTPMVPIDELKVVVRATDGENKPQIVANRPPVPKGSTGLHRVKAKVLALSA